MNPETIIIPMEDAPMHTPDRPVCEDDTCPCHQDEELVTAFVAQMFPQPQKTAPAWWLNNPAEWN